MVHRKGQTGQGPLRIHRPQTPLFKGSKGQSHHPWPPRDDACSWQLLCSELPMWGPHQRPGECWPSCLPAAVSPGPCTPTLSAEMEGRTCECGPHFLSKVSRGPGAAVLQAPLCFRWGPACPLDSSLWVAGPFSHCAAHELGVCELLCTSALESAGPGSCSWKPHAAG